MSAGSKEHQGGKPTKVEQTTAEKWEYLNEQLGFLRRSCDMFDQGHHAEAKRLATVVRTLLVHDDERKWGSKSLLRQLKLLPGMGFYDSQPIPKGFVTGGALWKLVTIKIHADPDKGSSMGFEAILLNGQAGLGRIASFDKWWAQDVVIEWQDIRLTRREVVGCLANKLGGAHIDPTIKKELADLIRGEQFAITANVNGEQLSVRGVELHTMRQIAHEVIKSIERKLKLGPADYFVPHS